MAKPWSLRLSQIPFFMDEVWYNDRDYKFRVMNMVGHRRCGKSKGASLSINKNCRTLLQEREISVLRGDVDSSYPRMAYIAPTKLQARDIIWNNLKNDLAEFPGLKLNNHLLKAVIPRPGLGDEIEVSLLASKNHDRIRGGKFRYVYNDEAQDAPEDAMDTSIKAALRDSHGYLYNFGTAKGQDHFYKFLVHYMNLGAPVFKFPIDKTHVFNAEEVKEIKEEYKDSMQAYEREYMCRFLAAIDGAFYYETLTGLKREPWFYNSVYDENKTIYVFVDIGVAKAFSAWVVQIPDEGEVINVLDFYDDYDNLLKFRNDLAEDGYIPDVILLPHDASRRVLAKAHTTTYYDLFREMFSNALIPTPVKKSPNRMTDIDQVGRHLHLLRMPSKEKSSDAHRGMRYLMDFSRKKDARTGLYTEQIDKSRGVDHCADALRNGMIGLGVKDGKIARRYSYKIGASVKTRNESIYRGSVFENRGGIFDSDGKGGYTNKLLEEEDNELLYKRLGAKIQQKKGHWPVQIAQ